MRMLRRTCIACVALIVFIIRFIVFAKQGFAIGVIDVCLWVNAAIVDRGAIPADPVACLSVVLKHLHTCVHRACYVLDLLAATDGHSAVLGLPSNARAVQGT